MITTLDLTNKYRSLFSDTNEHIPFLSIHGTLVKTDHMRHHKTNLKEFQRTEIIQNVIKPQCNEARNH